MSEYLSDEEQMARLHGWWRSNGVLLLVAVVLAVALVLGWRWYQAQQLKTATESSDRYAAYLAASKDAQPTIGASILAEFPGTTYAGFVRLQEAKTAAEAGDYAAAKTALQALVDSNPDRVVADLARLRLAHTQWQLADAAGALAQLGAIRSAGFRSQVAELKGDILLQQGDRAGAHEAYTAALAELGSTDERPVLEMKKVDTATPGDARIASAAEVDPLTDLKAEQAAAADAPSAEAAEVVTGLAADTAQDTTDAVEPAN